MTRNGARSAIAVARSSTLGPTGGSAREWSWHPCRTRFVTEVMVTPGALSGVSIVAQALAGRGDRVLVDSPGYPNAAERIRNAGARLATTEVDPDGWDMDATVARVRQVAPRLAYLSPDFHNPTGLLMSDEERARYAAELRRAHVTAIVDESHQQLALEGQEMPRPFAVHAPEAISVGSVSK